MPDESRINNLETAVVELRSGLAKLRDEMATLRTHDAVNDSKLESLQTDVKHIRASVESLTDQSSKLKGVWFAVCMVAIVLSSVAGLVVSILF